MTKVRIPSLCWRRKVERCRVCDIQRKIRSCQTQRAAGWFCSRGTSRSSMGNISMFGVDRASIGPVTNTLPPSNFCLAAVRQTLAKRDVCLTTPLAPHRDRGVRSLSRCTRSDLKALCSVDAQNLLCQPRHNHATSCRSSRHL
jgi:hypothetical protein